LPIAATMLRTIANKAMRLAPRVEAAAIGQRHMAIQGMKSELD
jgi:hypothetical protein